MTGIPIGGDRSGYAPKNHLNNLQTKVNDLSANETKNPKQGIASNELAEIVSTALSDDGQITKDELDIINTSLKASNSQSLTGVDFENPTTFSFKLKDVASGKEVTNKGSLSAEARVSSLKTIDGGDQAYIRNKTGLDISMKGYVKDAGEVRQVVEGLLKANGFDIDSYKNNTNGYADRIQSSIQKLMPSAKPAEVKEFCEILFGNKDFTIKDNSKGEPYSPELQTLQKGFVKMGLKDLLSQDGSGATDGKLGLRTSTAVDRIFASLKADMEIDFTMPSNTTVVMFGDNSGSMIKYSDSVSDLSNSYKEQAKLVGSDFAYVEGYNHNDGNEKHVTTALDFITKGQYEDTNGNVIKSPVDMTTRNKESKPMQLYFITDANQDPMTRSDLDKLIRECKNKNIDVVFKNPSSGKELSLMKDIVPKLTEANGTLSNAKISSYSDTEIHGPSAPFKLDLNKIDPEYGTEGTVKKK